MTRNFWFLLLLSFTTLGTTLGCQSASTRPLSEAQTGLTFNNAGEYLIGKGDVIGLRIHGDSGLSGNYTVDDHGDLSIPLIGFLAAEGLTIKGLRDKVETGISRFIHNPKVGAWLVERRSFHAYFCGEFVRTGLVSFSEPVTLIQGIALAGGITSFANKTILILRRSPKGKIERYSVNYDDLVNKGGFYDTFRIDRADTIIAE